MPVGGFGSRRSRAQLRGLLMGVIGLLIFLLLLSSSSSSHSSTAVPKASAKFPKRPPPPKEVAVQEPEKAAEITQNVSKDPQEPSVSPETLKKLKTLSARARALSFSLPDDFAELRVRSKVFMDLFSAVVPNKAYEKMNLKYTDWQEIQSGLDALEGLMYPMSPEKYPFGTRSLYEGFKGRGIVMSTGNWHFRYTIHAIHNMRSLKCKLPIEIYYNGEGDLRQENIDMLRALEGVRVIDLKPFFKPGKGDIGGWAIKPFAMLFSSFQEMIFIDSDALFFQDPAFIFDWKSYKDSGMIVFRDRTIGAGDLSVLKFFKAMVPDPSDYAKSNRFWKELSVHEGESGVVVVDKSRAGFYILLMAQNMNSPPYQKKLYKAIHGDKESFWMAAEALGVTYAWAPGGGGTVGYPHPEKKNSVCGGLFHVDEDYAPLWFNGGLIKNKHADEGHEPMQLTHFAIDRTFKNLNWDWETPKTPFCLQPENPELNVSPLSAKDLATAESMVALWKSEIVDKKLDHA